MTHLESVWDGEVSEKRGKNILLILTDQQRKDSLGCYGNPYCRTPNIDRIASNGVRFDRAYVANPICMPNRLSIATGRHPRNHGLWTNGVLLDSLPPTLGDHLSSRGYQTASIGKVHAAPYGGDGGQIESAERWKRMGDGFDWCGPYAGFDHVELTIGHTRPLAHYGRWFREHGGRPDMLRLEGEGDTGQRSIPSELHDSSFVAERASAWLEQAAAGKDPFFLVASFPDPHHPFNPPAEVASDYPTDRVRMPVGSCEDLGNRPGHYALHGSGRWSRWDYRGRQTTGASDRPVYDEQSTRERIAATYAMVDLIDRSVGRIIETLECIGRADETVVVFTSDHGELLGDHGLWYKGPFFYQGLVRVPLIISAPGGIKGATTQSLASSIDLVPTLCELVGCPVPAGVDGRSLAEVVSSPDASPRDRCLIEYRNGYGTEDRVSRAVVNERYQYVRHHTGEEELTDLIADPEERVNLAVSPEPGTRPSLLFQMRGELIDELADTESHLPEQICHA